MELWKLDGGMIKVSGSSRHDHEEREKASQTETFWSSRLVQAEEDWVVGLIRPCYRAQGFFCWSSKSRRRARAVLKRGTADGTLGVSPQVFWLEGPRG